MDSTYANIYLENLKNNYQLLEKLAPGKKICCPVKADAYGHGIVQISKYLLELGADYLAVSRPKEILKIRKSGVQAPILLLSLCSPKELEKIVMKNVDFTVDTLEYANAIGLIGAKKGIKSNVHLKIETGMGRVGCFIEDSLSLAKGILNNSNLNLKGISTHLSSSDSLDKTKTNNQLSIFTKAINILKKNDIEPELIHYSNSGGTLGIPGDLSNMVRPGIALYGYSPGEHFNSIDLKPVLELVSTVVRIKKFPQGSTISYGETYVTTKEEYIGILPIGYGDGLPRSLSSKGHVLIDGELFPIVGRICMDQTLVRLNSSVKLYSKAVIISSTNPKCSAEQIAQKTNTISYEILTNLKIITKKYIRGVD